MSMIKRRRELPIESDSAEDDISYQRRLRSSRRRCLPIENNISGDGLSCKRRLRSSRRRCLPIESDSSEDDLPWKRRLGSSNTSSLHGVSFTNNRRNGGRLPIVTSEEENGEYSSSQVIDCINHRFNNYDSDSSDGKHSRLVLGLTETKSGEEIVKPVDCPLNSSDSDVPVRVQRKTKRMKLCSSSSESSSEDEHSEGHKRVIRVNNSVTEENQDRPNTSSNSNLSRTVQNRVSVNNRKWRRIESDNRESETSSEDDIRPRILRHHSRTVFYSNSSSSDSDDEFPIRRPIRRRAAKSIIYSDDDDNSSHQENSGEDAEVCPICLSDFKLQEIGKPSTCDHCFCLGCLKEWANNNNTCPVDRRPFTSILVFSSIKGTPIQEIPVFNIQPIMITDAVFNIQPIMITEWDNEQVEIMLQNYYHSSDDQDEIPDDQDGIPELCSSCLMTSRNDSMIYCDACYDVYHLQCVNPPLDSFPVGPWICTGCQNMTE